jgi:hypothetical protein
MTSRMAPRRDDTDTSSSSSSSSSSSDEQLSFGENVSNSNSDIHWNITTTTATATATKTTTDDTTAATALDNKKIRVAKAQAEIDRILSCPVDPPFDMESELKKVISISPPLVVDGSAEYELEQEISQMEEDLYKAVKQQDYSRAKQQQTLISQRHVDDCGAVLQVNSAFYKAFSEKDAVEMERIWLKDNTSVCIHPSYNPLLGYRTVMESWERMFSSSDGSFQRNWMEPTNIRLTVRGATAIVTCEEQVYARRFVRGKRRQTELINRLLATNIFRKVAGKWYLNYHHASWHAESEAAKIALKRGGMSSSTTKNSNPPGGEDGMSSNGRTRIVIRGGRAGPKSDNANNEGPSPLDGILGINNFGPLLGDDSGPDTDEPGTNSNGPVKRIFMGSLSDILNGGLGDLLEGSGKNNKKNINNDGQNDAIIQFSRIQEDGDDEDGDEDDLLVGSDDQDEEEEGDEDDEVEMINIFSRSFSSPNGEKLSSSSRKSGKSTAAQGSSLRQKCIATLRKLAARGRISAKQKRVLLTDIINCSAKGESSMVEVAYELLCEGEDVDEDDTDQPEDHDTTEEEFADQCRVFASSLPDATSLL